MHKKIVIGVALTAMLLVGAGGAAYAAADGSDQGYRGGTSAVNATAQTQTQAQDGTGISCDGTCDGAGEGRCDGTCDGAAAQGTTAQNMAQSHGPDAAAQNGAGVCNGTCDGAGDQTSATGDQAQQRQRNGSAGAR
jgi:hypothetical protein